MPQPSTTVALPLEVTGRADVLRLVREIEVLNDESVQYAVQSQLTSSSRVRQLQPSSMLQQISTANEIDLGNQQARESLLEALRAIVDVAPAFHVSFATEPPQKQLQRIVEWLRESVHSYALVSTSVIPSITAGCILRTPNKMIDLSLRKSFEDAQPELLKGIRNL